MRTTETYAVKVQAPEKHPRKSSNALVKHAIGVFEIHEGLCYQEQIGVALDPDVFDFKKSMDAPRKSWVVCPEAVEQIHAHWEDKKNKGEMPDATMVNILLKSLCVVDTALLTVNARNGVPATFVMDMRSSDVATSCQQIASDGFTPIKQDDEAFEQECLTVKLTLLARLLAKENVETTTVKHRPMYTRNKSSDKVQVVHKVWDCPSVMYPGNHHKTGASGIVMPLHAVRGHWRRYKSGKVVWVSAHERGDPNVQRKTITSLTASKG